MPPRRPARPIPPDVDTLRAALDGGKIVRVGIAPSGQFPDGVTGRVRRIGQPEIDGEEFIFVEVPVGGSKDVLPFAATDLIGSPARKSAPPAVPATPPPPVPANRPLPTAMARPTVVSSASARAAAPGPMPVNVVEGNPAPAVRTSPVQTLPVKSVPAKPATGRGKRAPVTITISTAGDESATWRVEARIGAKVAVRPTPVPPSRVWEIVRSLGEEKLTEVVQTLLEDHRRSTQARADALAAELSALQAELQSFPDNGRAGRRLA